MKNKIHKLFIGFLVVYTIVILNHTKEISFDIESSVLFFSGFSVALFAHVKQSKVTIGILFFHMALEWFEWSQEKLTLHSIVIYIIHVILDFVFLSHELKVHIKKDVKILLAFTLTILVAIFCFGKFVSIGEHGIKTFEVFVIGGVLGCLLSHIYFHLTKEV